MVARRIVLCIVCFVAGAIGARLYYKRNGRK